MQDIYAMPLHYSGSSNNSYFDNYREDLDEYNKIIDVALNLVYFLFQQLQTQKNFFIDPSMYFM